MKNIGIFLDRDGTINEEVNYLSSPADLHLIPGSAVAIREANRAGFKVFVATNQSGIARGLITENQLATIHQALVQKLQHEDARLDAIFYCPHHPEAGIPRYRKKCNCRKPNIGMLTQATKEFDIDLTHSFIIGDKMIDMQTGNNSGAIPILVLTGYGQENLEHCQNNKVHVERVAKDLLDAFHYIQQITQKHLSFS